MSLSHSYELSRESGLDASACSTGFRVASNMGAYRARTVPDRIASTAWEAGILHR